MSASEKVHSSSSTLMLIMQLAQYGNYLMRCVPKWIQRIVVDRNDQLIVYVSSHQHVPNTLSFLKTHWNALFEQCVDITAVDTINMSPLVKKRHFGFVNDQSGKESDINLQNRFSLHYMLQSVSRNSRLIVQSSVAETQPMPSVTSIYPSAIWSEREVYDMFGIIFSGHSDLRRILTDYQLQGHPLRKDFPLSGHVEVRFDEEAGRVITEPVQLTQEYRKFHFENPWESSQKQT